MIYSPRQLRSISPIFGLGRTIVELTSMEMTEDNDIDTREIFERESWVCQSGSCDAWTEVDVVSCLMRSGGGFVGRSEG